jgi:release factor glutamine methyltransferase
LNRAAAVGALRRRIAAQLAEAFAARGYDGTPALDARVLVAHAMGMAAANVPLHDDEAASADVERAAVAYAKRRARGEPVARIVGRKEFHGHDFLLSPDTLVPRPETETIVDAVLARTKADEAFSVLDLGTGSGAILLAILAARPHASGLGIDLAPGAIETAGDNAVRLGLSSRADFRVGDWAAGIAEQFDVVVANPPYIESETIDTLPVDVKGFDPHLALDGGRDGLDAMRAILADLDRILAPQGAAFIEIGAGQREAVAALAEAKGLSSEFLSDLAGIDRVAVVKRR